MYLHPSVDPSLTHFFGEFPGLGLAVVPDVVVPEADLCVFVCTYVYLCFSCSYLHDTFNQYH